MHDVPNPAETFDLPEDAARCAAAARSLLAHLALPGDGTAQLLGRYAEPHRVYHDAGHVGLLWLRYLAHGGAPDDRGTALAIAFHDAVHQPGARDNEARSAALLPAWADGVAARWAASAILATADHLAYAGADKRVLRLLDLDLTPLAERPARFARNGAALRQEEPDVPDRLWRCRQHGFLSAILARAPLFRSGLGGIYEAPARANLLAALRDMES